MQACLSKEMRKSKLYFIEEIQKCKPFPEFGNPEMDAIFQLRIRVIIKLGNRGMPGGFSKELQKCKPL